MNKLMYCAAAVLSAALIFVSLPCGAEDAPSDSAASSVLMCADTGEVLCGHDWREKRGIASTTKIMTALLGLEYAEENDCVVRITPEMYAEGSSMYLREGEKLRMSQLVRGMMAVSGNDAANAVALTVGGSYEGFARMMNARADEIGMRDTHFVTPSGLDDDEHYSTAYDMALLGAEAMKLPALREAVSSSTVTVAYESPKGKTVTLKNHNRLLREYEGCIGIKTGYTDKSGRTLVSCAERNGVRLVAVTLSDRDDWRDHTALLDYGFSQVSNVRLSPVEKKLSLPVAGTGKSVDVFPDTEVWAVIRPKDKDSVTERLCAPRFLYAPVGDGYIAGRAQYILEGRVIAEASLIVRSTAEKQAVLTE